MLQQMFRIKMVWDQTIQTKLGRESRYIVYYSDGTVRARWFVVNDITRHPFTL